MISLLNKHDAAAYLGISVRTLDRRIAAGRLPYVSDRPGARVHFRQSDLDQYIKKNIHTVRRG